MGVHDLAVIGGGIAGVSVFERAARAGLKTVLLERGAAGGATTAVTSALLHGGLRYLPYDVGTSYAMCREIERLRRERPDLLVRQSYLWPLYRGARYGGGLVEALQDYYDLFAPLRGARPHAHLTADEAVRFLPGLSREGLRGAVVFDDGAWTCRAWSPGSSRPAAPQAASCARAGGRPRSTSAAAA